MKQIMHLVIITVLALASCQKEENNPIEVIDSESLTLQLIQIFEESDFPGFTVGIVKDGMAVYQRSFGFQNIENNIEYTNYTIQPIGSVSKTFIAAALVKSIELGYFSLETPINDILTEPIINPKNPSAEIRVKHLVNHTSGLVDEDNTYTLSYYLLDNQDLSSPGAQVMQSFGIIQRTPKTLEEFIKAYYYEGGDYYSMDNFIDSEPGEVEIYSNVAASLAAYLVEVSSGISYQEFLQSHVFDLLGMSQTTLKYELPNSKYATLYYNKEIPLPYYEFESFPDGGVKTSNEDMMKYLLNMLEGQRGESNILFDEAYYDLLFTETSGNHTIFWDIGSEDNAFGHTGSDPGLVTELYFNGSENSGFFILFNCEFLSRSYGVKYRKIKDSINMFLSS